MKAEQEVNLAERSWEREIESKAESVKGAVLESIRVFRMVRGSPHPACGHLLPSAEKEFISLHFARKTFNPWAGLKTANGRARHSVRAVVVNQNALVGRRRRAEDCSPYLSEFARWTVRVGLATGSLALVAVGKDRRVWNIITWITSGAGRARHSVRAVANQNAFVGRRRRAEDCPPYLGCGLFFAIGFR